MFSHLPNDIGTRSLSSLCKRKCAQYDAQEDVAEGVPAFGWVSSAEYGKRERVRFRKGSAFLSVLEMRDKLLAATMTTQLSLRMLGKTFAESRLDDSPQNILHWMVPASSPPRATVDKMFQLLSNANDPRWNPVSKREWPMRSKTIVLANHCFMIGSIILRSIDKYDNHWPFRMAHATRHFPMATRETTSTDLKKCLHCSECGDT